MALSRKRRVFIEEYLQCWNKTEAARKAGYAHPGQQGHRLLKNVEIAAEIKRRVDEKVMSADEALVRLSEIARSAYSDYIDKEGVDLDHLKKDGKMHLVKSIYETKYGPRVEFHDAFSALVKVGEAQRLFKTIGLNMELDMSQLSDEQLKRIASGEDPLVVLATSSES